jgi:hypothetical protein
MLRAIKGGMTTSLPKREATTFEDTGSLRTSLPAPHKVVARRICGSSITPRILIRSLGWTDSPRNGGFREFHEILTRVNVSIKGVRLPGL